MIICFAWHHTGSSIPKEQTENKTQPIFLFLSGRKLRELKSEDDHHLCLAGS